MISSAIDSRVQRLASDDASFNLKRWTQNYYSVIVLFNVKNIIFIYNFSFRSVRNIREPGLGLKRLGDGRPQGVFAR